MTSKPPRIAFSHPTEQSLSGRANPNTPSGMPSTTSSGGVSGNPPDSHDQHTHGRGKGETN